MTSSRNPSADSHPGEPDRLIVVDYILTERRRYDEIRDLFIDQLAFIWMKDSTTETTRASVDKKIDSFFEGDLEHAAETLSALWEIANRDGDIKAPSNDSPVVSLSHCLLSHIMQECLLYITRPRRPRVPPTGPL